MNNKKILIVLGVILLMAGVAVFIFLFQFFAPQAKAEKESITVNLNTTESKLIPKLKEQGYIKSEWAFNFILENKGWQGKINPGGYIVSKSMNVWQLANILVNEPSQKWVVLSEGLRKEEVADIFQKEFSWTEETKIEFLINSMEGYLFPDTYLFNLDYTGQEVAKRMENHFNEKVADIFKKADEKNIKNDTLVVLASLIQREAANEEEMPLIAGVIWSRWLKDMPFQIDASIQYALGESGSWWKKVTTEDYKIDSPYNIYINKGRPPGPICNPGLAALNAVVDSEETGYLYYLHDSQGQIHLAKTYKEHLENIKNYLLSN